MAKKTERKEAVPLPPIDKSKSFSIADFKVQALVLIILGFIFYANSFSNEYAFDDGIVIIKNEYVQKGFSGIGKILTKDAYDSFYTQGNVSQQFSGGRYRPLSIISFAIEQELFGSKAKDKPENDLASLRHAGNVVLYIFSVVLMLWFLSTYIFKKNPLIAFIASLLFLIHPLHTEVVANIKSRDEIMSFLFIMLTFIYVFRYRENKRKLTLYGGMLFYFLALLAKEYAITLVIFIPMLLYIVKRDTFGKSISSALPFFIVAAVYLTLRISSIGIGTTQENSDVLNNPFKFASPDQKLATKIEILLLYLRMLLYPNPLSYDYSYNTIPYVNFGNGLVWLSLLIHLSAIVAAVVLFFKRNILAFAIAFYMLHLMLVSNFILDVGATMGERLVYHSSFGLMILIAVAVVTVSEKINPASTRTIVLSAVGLLVTFWCGAKVIERNPQWKNDMTLFLVDAPNLPESALANGNAGMCYYNLALKAGDKKEQDELLQKALNHLNKAVEVHHYYVNGYLNLGVTYLRLKQYEKAKANFDIVKEIYPNNPLLPTNYRALAVNYFNEALNVGGTRPDSSVKLLERAVELAPDSANYWYNLGGAAFTIHDYEKARMAWEKALEINPDFEEVKKGMAAIPITK